MRSLLLIWIIFSSSAAHAYGFDECDSIGYGDLDHRMRAIHYCMQALVKENSELKSKIQDLEHRLDLKDIDDGTWGRTMEAKARLRKKK